MRKLMVTVVAAAGLAVPALAQAAPSSGVVVKVDRASKLVAVVGGQGRIVLVHTTQSLTGLRPGQRVSFDARQLRNHTVATNAFTVGGKVRTVHVRGIALQATRKQLVLTAHGAVLKLTPGRKLRTLSSVASGVKVGSTDDVTLSFDSSGNEQATGVQQIDPTADVGEIEGHVGAEGNGQLTVVSDGVTVTLHVPGWIDLAKLQPGEQILVYFVVRPDGSFALEAVAGDANEAQANDAQDEQGNVDDLELDVQNDEDQPEQNQNDEGDLQLAQAELQADVAGIIAQVQEVEQTCQDHLHALKNSGASTTELAAASLACQQELNLEKQHAQLELQAANTDDGEQLASDPDALAQLQSDERALGEQLNQEEQTVEQDLQTEEEADGVQVTEPDKRQPGP
jgi:hypothetical protein